MGKFEVNFFDVRFLCSFCFICVCRTSQCCFDDVVELPFHERALLLVYHFSSFSLVFFRSRPVRTKIFCNFIFFSIIINICS